MAVTTGATPHARRRGEPVGLQPVHGFQAWPPQSPLGHAHGDRHLEPKEVYAIAEREGWPAKYRKRGGVFGVIELWIEGRQMVEVLTPEMQAEYLAGMNIANWKRMLAARAQAQEKA